MSCADCQAAVERPHFGFRANCPGCKARSVARGPDFFRCRTAGKQDLKYRELLARVGVTHAEVVAAAATDKERASQ